MVGGAVAAMAGLLPLLAFGFILASDVKFMLPGAAQPLTVLDNDYFLPVVAGFFVFGVVAGLAAAGSKAPARWMGWVLAALGIICGSWFPRSRSLPSWPCSSGPWWPGFGWRSRSPRRFPRESRTSPSPQPRAAPQATPRNEARL